MSVSGIGSAPPALPTQPKPAAQPKPALAPDGDTQAVEAAETAATKIAEMLGGSASKGGVNKHA